MKAIGLYRSLPPSHPESLVDVCLPQPRPGDEDLLVRVDAIAVNPADCRMRLRKADDGRLAVLGWDAAGEVVEAGRRVRGFTPGDRVFYAGDLTRDGANCEFHAVDARLVGHAPRRASSADAAALPLAGLTAWEALFERLGLSPERGEAGGTLLIVGGAGGVGSIAIQLARLVPGLRVLATASRPESRAWCLTMGAHAVLDHGADLLPQLDALGVRCIERVLLLNAPDRHFEALAERVAPMGAVCSIVPFAAPPPLDRLMRSSASFSWAYVFTRSMFRTADMARQGGILDALAALMDAGQLRSTCNGTPQPICAAHLRSAHAQLDAGRSIGKIVLAGFAPDTPLTHPTEDAA